MTTSCKKPSEQNQKNSEEKIKKESLERLVQSYYQAKEDNDVKQINFLTIILKRLGWNKFKR